tara:strand:- start:1788 stop:2684 length:897 start_codon:yes stop_codon:yes gene_type:complete
MSSLTKGTIRIKLRQDSSSNWTSQNPTLAAGELGFETDSGMLKVGDGSTAWTSLTYVGEFTLVDGDGTSFTMNQTNVLTLVEGEGIDINHTDTTGASRATTISCNLEGTELKSTGESGGSKFLREDGDGTCSWQTVAGGGGGDYQIFFGGRGRCQYNNWYYAGHASYGPNYYYYYGTTGTTANPSSFVDSIAPYYLVPKNGTITGYTIVGNITTTDTWEWFCGKLTQPTFGSAGNWSVSQVGATQSAGGTANILYKWEQTGLSVSVNKNDSVGFWFRRTTDNDSSYSYCEFAAYITLE